MHIDYILILVAWISLVNLRCFNASNSSLTHDSSNFTNDEQIPDGKVSQDVRICCPYDSFAKRKLGEFKGCEPNKMAETVKIGIYDGKLKSNVSLTYFKQFDKICDEFEFAFESLNYKITKERHVLVDDKPFDPRNSCILVLTTDVEPEIQLVTCLEKVDEWYLYHVFYSIAMLTSVVFIIATIVFYICLPELLNFRMRICLCYLISLAVTFVSLAWVHYNGTEYQKPNVCKTIASIAYFSILSTATWSNAISFDVMRNYTIKSAFSPARQNITEKQQQRMETKKLLLNVVYAWGLPTLLLTTGLIIDSIESIPSGLTPGIGTETCFLKEQKESKFLYYHLPFCIIFSMNFVLFFFTAMKIRRIFKHSTFIQTSESQPNTNRENFALYLRLFLIMGVTWLTEGLSFTPVFDMLPLLTGSLNISQGIIIFVLFVSRPEAVKAIKKRWRKWRRMEHTSLSAPLCKNEMKHNMTKVIRTDSRETIESSTIPIELHEIKSDSDKNGR